MTFGEGIITRSHVVCKNYCILTSESRIQSSWNMGQAIWSLSLGSLLVSACVAIRQYHGWNGFWNVFYSSGDWKVQGWPHRWNACQFWWGPSFCLVADYYLFTVLTVGKRCPWYLSLKRYKYLGRYAANSWDAIWNASIPYWNSNSTPIPASG